MIFERQISRPSFYQLMVLRTKYNPQQYTYDALMDKAFHDRVFNSMIG